MDDQTVSSDVIKQFKIPPTARGLIEIQKELKKDNSEVNKIAIIIAEDTRISALILAAVHSSFSAVRQKVTLIHHSIILLGIKNIVNIVTDLNDFDYKEIAGDRTDKLISG